MVLFPEGLKALKQVAKQVGLDLRGAYLNLDGGFDSAHHRKGIFNAGLLPNLKENPRNRKTTKRGRKRLFNVCFRQACVCDVKVASVAGAFVDKTKTKPAVPPAVPSRVMRLGSPSGVKHSGPWRRHRQRSATPVKRWRACERQGGSERGWHGRVNRGARLINVVMVNKPKALTGWDHKVCSTDGGRRRLPSGPSRCRRTGRTSPMRAQKRNTGSP